MEKQNIHRQEEPAPEKNIYSQEYINETLALSNQNNNQGKRSKNTRLIILLIVLSVILASFIGYFCRVAILRLFEYQGIEKEEKKIVKEYVKGEVAITFRDEVSSKEAEKVIESYGLKLEWGIIDPYRFKVIVEVNKEAITKDQNFASKKAQEIKRKDKIIHGENYLINSAYSLNNEIHISSDDNRTTVNILKNFIDSFDDIILKSAKRSSRIARVKLPDGKEDKWIKILENTSIVQDVLRFPAVEDSLMDVDRGFDMDTDADRGMGPPFY